MKKILLIGLACVLGAVSCKKGDEPAPAPVPSNNNNGGGGNGGSISAVPATFTQKVLLETFVGAWCSTCPDADSKRDQVVSNNNGRAIAVSVHQTDGMSIALFGSLYTLFSQYSPSGMVNRTPSLGNVLLSPAQWMSNATVALGKTPACGLALTSAVSGGSATVEVHAGFNMTLTGDYRLVVYLVEDSVTGSGSGYDQMNAYNNSPGSPYYNKGNPIIDYHHNRVVRQVLTAATGDPVPASVLVQGGEYIRNFSGISVTASDAANLYLVAFVTRHGTTATTHEVLNVQAAKIGALKNWD